MTFGQILTGRKLIEVSGGDASDFLNGLITCEVDSLATFESAFGALLSPQGKILFDFFLVKLNDGYLLDVAESIAEDLTKRLTFYRLRKDVIFSKSKSYEKITALWDGAPQFDQGLLVKDPRLPRMGWRHYALKSVGVDHRDGDYDAHRISLGMPDGGSDYPYSDVFPHDTLMDQFGGVDFKKGCFVGQEVVSRMQHRGTARKRIVKVLASGPLPNSGTSVVVDNRNVGVLGHSVGNSALALVRLDRVADAIKSQKVIAVEETPVEIQLQDWVSYTLDASG